MSEFLDSLEAPRSGAPAPLGMVVGGSLNRGIDVRLATPTAVEEAKVGTFATAQGTAARYFGMITDLRLETADARLAAALGAADPALTEVLAGTSAYAVASFSPMLALGVGEEAPRPARAVPPHFAPVHRASSEDVGAVFGHEDAAHVYVGSPLDMEDARVCLDLGALAERSNGVFGKSGSGKSFLTRILLAAIVQRGAATNLVFDMHSEYGWAGTHEGGYAAKGLKQLFGERVSLFSLDPASSRRRGVTPDATVQVGMDEVEPEDIAILAPTLGITDLGVQASYAVARHLDREWVHKLLDMNAEQIAELADALRENLNTLEALARRLRGLQRLGFLTERAVKGGAVGTVLEHLAAGNHVVLEFGRYGDDLTAYLLVANLLTRRIHADYRHRTEESLASGTKAPTPLVITIEEAHRFLAPGLAGQTIFGAIAREMRKYRVTLLVVDQRPSGIDPEVLSQVGTRLACQLDNERDVEAVLTGAPGGRELRAVLARLESKQQALLFGHALPMPVVVRVRDYDEGFYRDMTTPGHGRSSARREDLF
ncbi:MAG: ATP-binding protein [Chloroflexota bacterium]